MTNRKCANCGIYKNLKYFYKDHTQTGGYSYSCKDCKNYARTEYYKKYPWMKTYKNIISRCNNKNCKDYKNYGGKGIECLITKEEIKELWFRDKAYDMERPSIDRIDSNGHYEYDNCRYLEHLENSKRVDQSFKYKPIIQYSKNNKFIREWKSQTEASLELNISASCICSVCKGNQKTAGGYIWRYKNG